MHQKDRVIIYFKLQGPNDHGNISNVISSVSCILSMEKADAQNTNFNLTKSEE